MAEKNKIGVKVRQIRESRKLSYEETAERSGLQTDLIQQIEEGALIPSLTPLIKIARVLGVRLGTFLDDHDNIGPVLCCKDKIQKVVRFSGKDHPANSDLDFYSLAADKAARHMEPFIIDIYPSSKKDAKLSSHEGEEFIYCLNGIVEINYGKETYKLNPGDSIYYDSIVAHNVHSSGDSEAKILAVIYAPF